MAGPLVFVADLEGPELADDDRHHLTRVLRVRAGTEVVIADGEGRWRTAVLSGDAVEPAGPILVQPAPSPEVGVGFALVKGDRPELIVQKLTELGVDRIWPFRAERSVVRWDAAKADKALTRLRAVARNAAMQCHRARLPVVEPVVDLGELVSTAGVAMADRHGDAPTLDHPTILVGPEGGWSPEEQALTVPKVVLGVHVLRAETAAVTAGAILTALRASLVGPTT